MSLIGHGEQRLFVLLFESFRSPHLTLFLPSNEEDQGGGAERRGRPRRCDRALNAPQG